MGRVGGYATLVVVAAIMTACGGDETSAGPEMNAMSSSPVTSPPAADQGGQSTTTEMGASGGAGMGVDQEPALNLGDLADMVIPMCDTSVESVTECGGVTCPTVGALQAAACTVSCCVEGACGVRTAALTVLTSTECAPVDLPDENCRDVNLGITTLQGCCDAATNTCGLLTLGVCTGRNDALTMMRARMGADAGMSMPDGGMGRSLMRSPPVPCGEAAAGGTGSPTPDPVTTPGPDAGTAMLDAGM